MINMDKNIINMSVNVRTITLDLFQHFIKEIDKVFNDTKEEVPLQCYLDKKSAKNNVCKNIHSILFWQTCR